MSSTDFLLSQYDMLQKIVGNSIFQAMTCSCIWEVSLTIGVKGHFSRHSITLRGEGATCVF